MGVYADFSVKIQLPSSTNSSSRELPILSVHCWLPVDIDNFTDYRPWRVPIPLAGQGTA